MNGKPTPGTSPDDTDWEYLRNATDEEIRRGIAEDPDARPTSPDFWRQAEMVTPETRTMRVAESHPAKLLNENDVVDAVCHYLEASGWTILERHATTERGIDVVAERPDTRERAWVEAKGATSARADTARFDMGFTPTQVRHQVAFALYDAARRRDSAEREGARLFLALPDDRQFRKRAEDIRSALNTLGVALLWVHPDRTVTTG
jgi:Holliday junction resolvase-like predicted endonuclease